MLIKEKLSTVKKYIQPVILSVALRSRVSDEIWASFLFLANPNAVGGITHRQLCQGNSILFCPLYLLVFDFSARINEQISPFSEI